jgi:hypothetical protein
VRVIGRADRACDLAGDQVEDHVRSSRMKRTRRHYDGWSALYARNAGEVGDHRVNWFQQVRLPLGMLR